MSYTRSSQKSRVSSKLMSVASLNVSNPWDAYNYAPASRTLTPTSLFNSYCSNYDYVHPGDTESEIVHNFRQSGTSVASIETVLRRCTGGGKGTWISYDMEVAPNIPFTVRVDDTSAGPVSKDYWVQINEINVYHRTRTTHFAWGKGSYAGAETYVFNVDSTYTRTGVVTIKFVNNTDQAAGDPSIASIWTLGSKSLPESSRGGQVININSLISGGAVTFVSNSSSNGAPFAVLDFGKSIGGTVSFNYSCLGTQNFKICYSNSAAYIGVAGDAVNGTYPVTDECQSVSLSDSGTWTCDTSRGGFRYLMLMKTNAGTINISDLSVAFGAVPLMSNPSAYTGYFYSNNDTINKVWYAGAYTAQLCTIDPHNGCSGSSQYGSWAENQDWSSIGVPGNSIFVDGSKRDRAIWDGDLAIAFPISYLSFNDTVSTKNALSFVFERQNSDGALHDSCYGRHSGIYHAWGVYSFADYILYSNDMDFLDSYWARFKNAIVYMIGKLSSGLYDADGDNWGYCEDNNSAEGSCIVYIDLLKAAQLADIKGDAGTADTYRSTAAAIKNAINSLLWDSVKGAYIESAERHDRVSTLANALSITYGVADVSKTEAIINYLNSHMKNNMGYYTVDYDGGPIPKNNSPFVGGHLLRALVIANNTVDAVSFIENTWGAMLTSTYGNGSTFWETLAEDGCPVYDSRDSFGHVWSAGSTSVLTECILGVMPLSPGYETYKVLPNPGGLTHVEGKVPVPNNKSITVSYDTNNSDSFSMSVNSSNNSGSLGTIAVPTFRKNVTVKVGGSTIWDGSFHSVSGIGGANKDLNYVYLTSVNSGTYNISCTYDSTPAPSSIPR